MRTYLTPWEAFPTDVTSPTPTQLTGPKSDSQSVCADQPQELPQPEPEQEETPSE